MRSLSDAVFYRPAKTIPYQHIDALFSDEIDWDPITTSARDMIQVALSIQVRQVTPSILLRFVSRAEVRRTVRAETTKIGAFKNFLDYVSFGGPVMKAVIRSSRKSSSNTPASSLARSCCPTR